MGRQPWLTRSALGRSAFESPDHHDNVPGNAGTASHTYETAKDAAQHDQLDTQAKELRLGQAFDTKGHPVNTVSSEFKNELALAQNDILATIGVCASSAQWPGREKKKNAHKLKSIVAENQTGHTVSCVDEAILGLSTVLGLGICTRLQVLRISSTLPLQILLRRERQSIGTFNMLTLGAGSNILYEALRDLLAESISFIKHNWGREWLKQLSNGRRPSGLRKDMLNLILLCASLAFEWLITPLAAFSLLQQLQATTTLSYLPSIHQYKEMLQNSFPPGILTNAVPRMARSREIVQSLVTSPLTLLYLTNISYSMVRRVLYRYSMEALERPYRPDVLSRQAAIQEDAYLNDICTSKGLKRAQSSVWGWHGLKYQFSRDLQWIGYKYFAFQRRYLTFTQFLSNSFRKFRGLTDINCYYKATNRTNRNDPASGQAEDIAVQEIANNVDQRGRSTSTNRSRSVRTTSSVVSTNSSETDSSSRSNARVSSNVMWRDISNQQVPQFERTRSHEISSAEASTGAFSSTADYSSSPSSTVSSSSQRNPASAFTAEARSNGQLYMNLNLPDLAVEVIDFGSRRGDPNIDTGILDSDESNDDIQPRFDEHSRQRARRTIVQQTILAYHPEHNDTSSIVISDSDTDTDESLMSDIVNLDGPEGPDCSHRMTALSCSPHDAVARRISLHVADFLFLPVRAYIVRRMVMSMLPMTHPLRQTVYLPNAWFGTGLGGGWRGAGRYIGNSILLWGLGVGVSIVLWEASFLWTWFCGVKWYSWQRLC